MIQQMLFHAVVVLIIAGFLGASFMMITPVENAEAGLVHICCVDWITITVGEGTPVEFDIEVCIDWDSTWHADPRSHSWSCS